MNRLQEEKAGHQRQVESLRRQMVEQQQQQQCQQEQQQREEVARHFADEQRRHLEEAEHQQRLDTQTTVGGNTQAGHGSAAPEEPPSYRMTDKADDAASIAWEYTPETYLQAKSLAHKRIKKARPSPPFPGGHLTTYAMMAHFDTAVDSGEKLLELVHWFDGTAKRIIISQTTRSDKNTAYAAARFQMDKLYRANVNSFQSIMNDLVKGKQIDAEDMDRHIEIYADLSEAKAVIDEMMKSKDYDRSDVVRRVLEARLSHLANRFSRRNDEQIIHTGRQLGLDDLIEEVHCWMSVLTNRGITSKPTTSKIAAAAITTEAMPSTSSYAALCAAANFFSSKATS